MSDFVDPYLDPVTGILRNKLGMNNLADLREAEGDIISLIDATMDGVVHSRDFVELKAIHKRLFEKIYDWAGEPRKVDIRKGSEEYFLDFTYIENGAKYVFDELASKDHLRGLERSEFVQNLAYFYEQLNFIHPFREGNGRTQRIFWQRIANDAGYIIDWRKVVGDELDLASMAGRVEHDIRPLEDIFERIARSIS